MIVGIGTDLVKVDRFEQMTLFLPEQLRRIFTQAELNDCALSQGGYASERLAARFAAKEAFYKALSRAIVTLNISVSKAQFITLAPLVCIKKDMLRAPYLEVDWPTIGELLQASLHDIQSHVSLSHEKEYAQAFVILERF